MATVELPAVERDRLVHELAARQRGVVDPDEVAGIVEDSWSLLARSARVTRYLPVLTRRLAVERVDSLARTRGGGRRGVPQVLFLCVHNAGRSQMAAALLQHHALGRVDVRSAGSAPSADLNAAVVASLAQVGIPLGEAFPKPVTDEVARAADVVVSMGCGDTCPLSPGARYLEWDLPDPDGLEVDAVAPIRDEIDRRVRALLDELT